MRKIIYTRPDGGISIVCPIINNYPIPEDITEAQAEQRAWEKLPADAINPRFVSEINIPTDRIFREAWEDNGVDINISMAKAREIYKNKLRELRTPKLAALDVEYYRADEAGDTTLKAQIASQKQALRDVTADPGIAATTTPEELKACIPTCLL